jgi:glycosyltransferase involved in cell wall biosynthesis
MLGYMAGFHGAEELLLDSLALAVEHGLNLQMLVAGSPLSSLAPKHHGLLKSRVFHVGRLPFSEVDVFLGACDALLLPLTTMNYDRGRYPHKLGDYLAAGRPTLLPDVGEAARRMKQAGLNDMVSEPGPEAFAELIRTWAGQPQEWESAGQRTRAAAERFWSWTSIHHSLVRIVLEPDPPECPPTLDG